MATLKPLVIHYAKNSPAASPFSPQLITIQLPTHFPYKDNKAVPWRYEVEFHAQSPARDQKEIANQSTFVTNIAGISGVTRSGRVYTLKGSKKKR